MAASGHGTAKTKGAAPGTPGVWPQFLGHPKSVEKDPSFSFRARRWEE